MLTILPCLPDKAGKGIKQSKAWERALQATEQPPLFTALQGGDIHSKTHGFGGKENLPSFQPFEILCMSWVVRRWAHFIYRYLSL